MKTARRINGSALAMVILILSVMLLLVVGLNQVVLSQQRSANAYADVELAQSYARLAMLAAESGALNYDTSLALETSVAANQSSGTWAKQRYDNDLNASGSGNIVSNGVTCNNNSTWAGFCYKRADSFNFNSDQSWQPWQESYSTAVKPCNSYTGTPGSIPMIDDGNSSFSRSYSSSDSSLCSQPRYMIEPLNLDFRGNYQFISNLTPAVESDIWRQNNGTAAIIYRINQGSQTPVVNSARLYRLTVRAFGRSGDTRVTLQEYIVIISNTQLRAVGDTANNIAHQIILLSSRWLRN